MVHQYLVLSVNMNRNTVNASISIEPELLDRAKDRARKVRRSLSGHVQFLIENDLAREAAMVPKLELVEEPKSEVGQ